LRSASFGAAGSRSSSVEGLSLTAVVALTAAGRGVEFCERAADALAREFREEIGSDIEDVRYLGTLENIYVDERHPGHELVRVYEARLAARSLYARDSSNFQIEDGSTCHALWKPLDDFATAPLYPAGLLDLIGRAGAAILRGDERDAR
jgi:ADP-ribose pyrophosphatase YjhB (NUDIX family)